MFKHFDKITDPLIVGLNDKLLSMLDNARTVAEVPFVLTSGLRTEEYNRKIGGVEDSAHLYGLAVDIQCTDSINRFNIIYGLMVAGFRRIGVSQTHIHADIDESKPKYCLFLE